jgi:hypothetical protein
MAKVSSCAEAQALLAEIMKRVGVRHQDEAMLAASRWLAEKASKMAKDDGPEVRGGR